MSDEVPIPPEAAGPPPPPPACRACAGPPWLEAPTLRAMEEARDRCLARGGTPRAAAMAAREVAVAHRPALPARMIAEAVAAVVPDPRRGRLP
jgi:hypothetical protein